MNVSLSQRLLSVARQLARVASFEDLLLMVRAEIQAAVGYKHAWLFVAESEPIEEVRLIDYAGALRGTIWDVAPLLRVRGDAMLEEIVRGDEPVVVTDARTDPRTDKSIVAMLQNRTIINIPLRLLEEPFGALGTGTFGDEEGCRPPTDAQLAYLIALASQISVAAWRLRERYVRPSR